VLGEPRSARGGGESDAPGENNAVVESKRKLRRGQVATRTSRAGACTPGGSPPGVDTRVTCGPLQLSQPRAGLGATLSLPAQGAAHRRRRCVHLSTSLPLRATTARVVVFGSPSPQPRTLSAYALIALSLPRMVPRYVPCHLMLAPRSPGRFFLPGVHATTSRSGTYQAATGSLGHQTQCSGTHQALPASKTIRNALVHTKRCAAVLQDGRHLIKPLSDYAAPAATASPATVKI
jgi:hypothetical protein